MYKNTQFFATMDPKRIIKMPFKGFKRGLRSYGMLFHDICWPVYFKFATRGCDRKPPCSLRASSPIWASEASLSRTRERAAKPRGARLTSLTQIGELARRLATMRNLFYLMRQKSFNTINRLI